MLGVDCMGLKQSVVIVNEYTVKSKSGKGSRGSTPGDYITRYIARDQAVEDLTPVQFDSEAYIERYVARKEATETSNSVQSIKQKMRDIQGCGGVTFGNHNVSLSHMELKRASKEIQNQFDRGKTVLKTVLSFDEEYLRKHGIIDKGFYLEKKGDYRGNIDQMKLRMAIMNGVDKMSQSYDDLFYVGSIQVDTKHVHCHLAMVDRGRGNLAKDGTQRGKISERSKRNLRRGIDMFLDDKQAVRMMSSNITHDKRNALCFIKKYTHEIMYEHGTPQFLLACLPKDKNLWRASTNRQEMRKANTIVREFVTEVLSEPDSGYKEALRHVDEYARTRQMNEDLTDSEYRALMKNGQERIITDCMNGVYHVLKQIPDEAMQVKTPIMSAMSLDYMDMAAEQDTDPMIEFGFKLRSYSSRLQYHKKEMTKYHDAVKSYENTENASESSKPLYDFFKEEEEYNAKLMCKYQHFLSFLPPKSKYEDEFDELMKYKHKIRKTKQLRDDPSPKRMSAENAEDYGVRVYDIHGGRYLTFAPDVLDRRIEIMEQAYEKYEDDFRYKLSKSGLTLDEKGVSNKKPYEFYEVKALDIHHLSYDFPADFPISKINVDEFIEAADKRYELFAKAKAYLDASGQSDAIESFAHADIQLMKDTADKMRINPVMTVAKPVSSGRKRNSKTVKLDIDYTHDMKMAINETIQTLQMGES